MKWHLPLDKSDLHNSKAFFFFWEKTVSPFALKQYVLTAGYKQNKTPSKSPERIKASFLFPQHSTWYSFEFDEMNPKLWQ